MAKWRKALALPRAERALLIEAARHLLRAWLMLRLLPFKQIAAKIGGVSATDRTTSPDIRKVRWAVETAARHLPLSLTCLPQAFAASWMLTARGGRPLLHYGVAKTETGFESHAWVELDGKPVIGHRVANRFTLLATFPACEGESQ
jgi:hypothetical protein